MKSSACAMTEEEARGQWAIKIEKSTSSIELEMHRCLECLSQIELHLDDIGTAIDDAFPPCEEEIQCFSVYKDMKNIFVLEKTKTIESIRRINETIDAMVCPVIETIEDRHRGMIED